MTIKDSKFKNPEFNSKFKILTDVGFSVGIFKYSDLNFEVIKDCINILSKFKTSGKLKFNWNVPHLETFRELSLIS